MTEQHVKILFQIGDEGPVDTESVWAVPVPGGYKLSNIPFFARDVACHDIVSAVPSADGVLEFSGVVEASGHSTVRIAFESESDVAAVRETLAQLGCGCELAQARFLAVDVPPRVPYAEIQAYLDEKVSCGVIEYEEACLGQDSL